MDFSHISPEPVALKLSPPLPGFGGFITSYLLRGEKMALIDPGPKACAHQLLAELGELGLGPESLDYILVTHIHIDHAGGLGELMGYATRARAIVHPMAIRHLVNPEKLWQGSLSTLGEVAERYGRIDPSPEARLVAAQEGMEVDLGGRRLQVLFTPGHALHHISFWDPERKEAYIGEAAGVYHPSVDALRPATPPPFDLETTLDSLAKLASLQPKSLCYGHGGCVPAERDTLDRYQRQLLRWRDIILSAVSQDKDEIFQALVQGDEELARLQALERPEFDREKFFISNSIAGFLGYLKGLDNPSP